MDSLTQAVLGATIGEAIFGKKIGHKAALTGALLGTVPDLDVLLTPFFSTLQKVSIHRGYSHSILFCVIGAFLLAYILNRIKWTSEIGFGKLWIFNFLVLFTHVLLDSFTTYGTQLFLPFSNLRVSFDSISVVDPIYTLPLLTGLLLSVFGYGKSDKRRNLPNTIGLIVSSLYLLFTLANKHHIENIFDAQIENQGIESNDLLTVPVKIGNNNWYGVAKDEEKLYIGKYSMVKRNRIEFHPFPINDHLLDDLDSDLVDQMKWFAKGFYTVAEKDGKIRIYNLQCDMQGVQVDGEDKAPTAFYYEIVSNADGSYELKSGMHKNK